MLTSAPLLSTASCTVHTEINGTPVRIHSIDVTQFDDSGLITEMKAYYGPSNLAAA